MLPNLNALIDDYRARLQEEANARLQAATQEEERRALARKQIETLVLRNVLKVWGHLDPAQIDAPSVALGENTTLSVRLSYLRPEAYADPEKAATTALGTYTLYAVTEIPHPVKPDDTLKHVRAMQLDPAKLPEAGDITQLIAVAISSANHERLSILKDHVDATGDLPNSPKPAPDTQVKPQMRSFKPWVLRDLAESLCYVDVSLIGFRTSANKALGGYSLYLGDVCTSYAITQEQIDMMALAGWLYDTKDGGFILSLPGRHIILSHVKTSTMD